MAKKNYIEYDLRKLIDLKILPTVYFANRIIISFLAPSFQKLLAPSSHVIIRIRFIVQLVRFENRRNLHLIFILHLNAQF